MSYLKEYKKKPKRPTQAYIKHLQKEYRKNIAQQREEARQKKILKEELSKKEPSKEEPSKEEPSKGEPSKEEPKYVFQELRDRIEKRESLSPKTNKGIPEEPEEDEETDDVGDKKPDEEEKDDVGDKKLDKEEKEDVECKKPEENDTRVWLKPDDPKLMCRGVSTETSEVDIAHQEFPEKKVVKKNVAERLKEQLSIYIIPAKGANPPEEGDKIIIPSRYLSPTKLSIMSSEDMLGITLFYNAEAGNLHGVDSLLLAGADINYHHGPTQETALIIASDRGNKYTVEVLLVRGANVLDWDLYHQTALHRAAEKGHSETIKILLGFKPCLNERDKKNGYTALHIAAEKGYMVSVMELVEGGARLDPRSYWTKKTPLELARAKKHKVTEEYLQEKLERRDVGLYASYQSKQQMHNILSPERVVECKR